MPVPVWSETMKEKQEENLTEGSYQLNLSNDETFTNRVDSIFGALDSLEQEHSEAVKNFEGLNSHDDDAEEEEEDHKSCSSSSSRSEEKKDEERSNCDLRNKLKRRPKLPDFVSNPAKWKKYSLKDDGTASFSKELSADQLNTHVAMEFIDNIKKTKRSSDIQDADDTVVFKVPELPSKSASSTSTISEKKSIFGTCHSSNARCMETYEFGQQSVKTKKHIDKESKRNSGEMPAHQVVLDYQVTEEVDNLLSNDVDEKDDKQENTVTASNESSQNNSIFISRGKKKNRSLRKPTCKDEDGDDE